MDDPVGDGSGEGAAGLGDGCGDGDGSDDGDGDGSSVADSAVRGWQPSLSALAPSVPGDADGSGDDAGLGDADGLGDGDEDPDGDGLALVEGAGAGPASPSSAGHSVIGVPPLPSSRVTAEPGSPVELGDGSVAAGSVGVSVAVGPSVGFGEACTCSVGSDTPPSTGTSGAGVVPSVLGATVSALPFGRTGAPPGTPPSGDGDGEGESV